MIDLVNTLMHQQHRVIIRSQQTRRKRSLAKRDCPTLNAETYINTGVYLSFGDGFTVWEEMRSDFSGG